MKKINNLGHKINVKLILLGLTLMLIASFFSACSRSYLKASAPLPDIYAKVYLIGDATTAAWNLNSAIAMTPTAGSANLFTWTGPLTAGQIKFLTAYSWSNDTFAPLTNNQIVTNGSAMITGGSPDYKWQLASSDAGTYKITVDTKAVTVTFVKQ
jgi:hypothetical protein